jgi:hypothetical protein
MARHPLALLTISVVLALAPVTITPAAGAAPSGGAESARESLRLRAAVRALPVAAENSTGYDRDLFRLWVDADSDCQDTREEVLVAESRVPISACTITTGEWFSWYDHETWTASSDVDIDHLVALKEAWDSGARTWDDATRERYANDLGDPRTLLAVTDNVNASKSDRDVAEWLPTYGVCRYVRMWVAVKLRWGLTVDATERRTLRAEAGQCANRRIDFVAARPARPATR